MRNILIKYIIGVFLISGLVAFTTPVLAAGETNYQDQQWISAMSIDKPAVDSDLNSLMAGVDPNSISSKNIDKLTKNFQIYSNAITTDSQKAIDHSDSYIVSPDLLPTKNAYGKAMYQAKWAGFYATQFSTNMLSNEGKKALDDFKNVQNCINSYNTNMNEATRLYDIYLKKQAA
jgi:hypothetical protein